MATIKEVAQKANVSIMTVSRVINSPEKVKEKTRNRVLQVMEELQFKPNAAAKALVLKQTRTIHIFIHSVLSTQDPFLMALLAGISDVLSASYYSFLIRREWDFPYSCDGVIALSSSEKDIEKLKKVVKEPLIIFGQTKQNIDWIDFDQYKGTYEMTQHMLEKGHKKIGYLGIKSDETFADDRLNGYKDALKNAGIKVDQELILAAENHTERNGYEMALKLMEKKPLTAIVCASDVIALGVLTAAKSLGVIIPDQISIGGFDGVFLDQIADPPLTTIEQPVHAIGQELARSLLFRIQNPNAPQIRKLIPPKLIERKTVKAVYKE